MFTVELQRRADRLAAEIPGARRVVTSSLHPGVVQSGIVQLTDVPAGVWKSFVARNLQLLISRQV